MVDKERIIGFIASNDLEKAIELMMNYNSSIPGFRNNAVILKARLISLEKDVISGIVDSKEALLREDRIRYDLLKLMDWNGLIDEHDEVKKLSEYFSYPQNSKKYQITLKFDLPVAKSMRPLNSFESFLMLFQPFFDNKSMREDTDSGHVTRCFDWDGNRIWTTCDNKLAANIWMLNSSKHLAYVNQNKESYSTLIIHKIGLNSIFGNGYYLYLESAHNVIQEISSEEMPYNIWKLVVARNSGKEINTVLDKHGEVKIGIFQRKSQVEKFTYSQFVIDSSLLFSKNLIWNIALYEINDDKRLTIIYGTVRNDSINNKVDILLIDTGNKKIISHSLIEGLQHISTNLQKSQVVTLGKEISILELTTFKVIKTAPLSDTRPLKEQGVISYSPCSRFIAVSYNFSGDIEVRSAENLIILCTFPGYGRPMEDISWSSNSQFLSCRYATFDGGRVFPLVVWDISNQLEILNVNTSVTYNDERAYSWSDHSTNIAILESGERIKVYEISR